MVMLTDTIINLLVCGTKDRSDKGKVEAFLNEFEAGALDILISALTTLSAKFPGLHAKMLEIDKLAVAASEPDADPELYMNALLEAVQQEPEVTAKIDEAVADYRLAVYKQMYDQSTPEVQDLLDQQELALSTMSSTLDLALGMQELSDAGVDLDEAFVQDDVTQNDTQAVPYGTGVEHTQVPG